MAEIIHNHPDEVRCDYFGGCPNTISYHEALHPESEWFVTKDGKAFCPLHRPIFTPEWRRASEDESE